MAVIDIILLIVFIFAAWSGFRKGFITQLGSVAAIIVAIIACRMLGATVEQAFFDHHPDWQTGSSLSHYSVSILANCIIYIVVYYAVILIARVLHKVSHVVLLAPLDHIAGAIFSVAKWGLLVSLLLNLYIVLFPAQGPAAGSHIAGGKAAEAIVKFAPWVLDTVSHTDDGDDGTDGEVVTDVAETQTVGRSNC
ncbi:MAG: CvpA family protein [Bacteroides sp.]|nr:CvpA family protein [Bacteroides sp.]